MKIGDIVEVSLSGTVTQVYENIQKVRVAHKGDEIIVPINNIVKKGEDHV